MAAGDPGLAGWAAVLAYAIAAGCCSVAAWRAAPADRRLWVLFACALAALALNKQLDLQSLLTQAMRTVAQAGGWYAHRRLAQLVFLLVLALLGAAVLAWLLIRMRGSPQGVKLAAGGLGCLVLFVIGRAASFHHFDEALGWQMSGIRLGIFPELAGSLLVALGALRAIAPRTPSEAEHEIGRSAVVAPAGARQTDGAADAEL